MSDFEFSRLPAYRRKGSPERLLRAAVYAFCSLPRPTRREAAQLDDLALPLIEKASVETRRYIAAALSECAEAPEALVRRLCDEPVGISAPLLMRSRGLCNIDLIALIGRHGMGHAHAIARRKDLDPRIAELVATLERIDVPLRSPEPATTPDAAEQTREKLRGMMVSDLPSQNDSAALLEAATTNYRSRWTASPPANFDKLRSAALTGVPDLFAQTLARVLGLAQVQTRALMSDHGRHEFPIAMRALALAPEQAFLLAACVFGKAFAHPESIRLFLDRFAGLSVEAAQATVRDWKMSMLASESDIVELEDAEIPEAANESEVIRQGLLRVS